MGGEAVLGAAGLCAFPLLPACPPRPCAARRRRQPRGGVHARRRRCRLPRQGGRQGHQRVAARRRRGRGGGRRGRACRPRHRPPRAHAPGRLVHERRRVRALLCAQPARECGRVIVGPRSRCAFTPPLSTGRTHEARAGACARRRPRRGRGGRHCHRGGLGSATEVPQRGRPGDSARRRRGHQHGRRDARGHGPRAAPRPGAHWAHWAIGRGRMYRAAGGGAGDRGVGMQAVCCRGCRQRDIPAAGPFTPAPAPPPPCLPPRSSGPSSPAARSTRCATPPLRPCASASSPSSPSRSASSTSPCAPPPSSSPPPSRRRRAPHALPPSWVPPVLPLQFNKTTYGGTRSLMGVAVMACGFGTTLFYNT